MKTSLRLLRLDQLDRALAPYATFRGQARPRGGWLRAVREALGRSIRAQAERVGVSGPSLFKAEASEAEERISLAQLRKLAEALDCELVYALVPRQSLSAAVRKQAETLARQEVLGVSHSMGLEAQRPSDSFVEQQIADRRDELLAGSWSRLWR